MKLTPLYEALIFIEDKGSSTIADLEFLNKSVIRGILGKMEAMKLIERENNRFKISPIGQELLNQYLDNLHRPTIHWDNRWRLVCFSVPESNRASRDKFRRELENMGLKMILTGLWLTPMNIALNIEQAAKKLGIYQNVIIAETNQITTGITEESLFNLWGFDRSKQEIYDYLSETEEFLKDKNRSSFEIKKMIFKYALILDNQPKVPIELFPKDWPQFRANLAYKKVRRLLG